MRKQLLFTLFGALALTALDAAPVFAQATRTWVSGVGDDVNPCSRTAPCKTFAGAISKTAAGGEINCLDPGGYGAVTITKSMTILCDGIGGSILASATNGINVNDSATATPGTIVVTISGLDIDGAGTTVGLNGIIFTSGAALHVRNTQIRNFRSSPTGGGITFAPAGAAEMFVTDTSVSDSGGSATSGGITVRPGAAGAANVHLTRVHAENNTVGIIADGSSSTNGVNVNIKDSVASGGANGGINATSAAAKSAVTISVTSTMVTGNVGVGVTANGAAVAGAGSAIVRVGGSMITANAVGISTTGVGQVRSYGNNQVNSNSSGEVFSATDVLK